MKRVIVLIFCVIFVVDAHAQLSKRRNKKTQIGALEGVTTSQISGDAHAGFHKYGMVGGLFFRKDLSYTFTIQLEAIYKEKGSRFYAKRVPNPDPSNVYYESPTRGYFLRMNYIEFPLLLQYTFSDRTRFNGMIVELGPGFGIPVHIEEYQTVPGYNIRQYGPHFNYYELSANVGLSYYLATNFGFNLRLSRSLNSIRDYYRGEKTGTFTPGQQHTVISLSLNYQLPL